MSTKDNHTKNTLLETMKANWKTYVAAWNATDNCEREKLLAQAAVDDSCYIDPNVELKGHEALAEYMAKFHQQVPNSRFVLTRFIAHHCKSIADWDVQDKDGNTLFTGLSYGTYNAQGQLTAEHGFFEITE